MIRWNILKEDDLAPDKNGKPTRKVPLWLPTVSVRVAFLADIAGKIKPRLPGLLQ